MNFRVTIFGLCAVATFTVLILCVFFLSAMENMSTAIVDLNLKKRNQYSVENSNSKANRRQFEQSILNLIYIRRRGQMNQRHLLCSLINNFKLQMCKMNSLNAKHIQIKPFTHAHFILAFCFFSSFKIKKAQRTNIRW